MKICDIDNNKLEEIWDFPYPIIPDIKIDASWKQFQEHLKQPSKRNYPKTVLVAAILLLLFTTYFFLEIHNPTITVNNYTQIEKEVTLPDNSLVILKPGSGIQFKENFRSTRGVDLKGEAFFHIVKDSLKVFEVATKFIAIKVFGTSFSVIEKEGSEDVEVSLYTGRVLIAVKDKVESWTLIPGERFNYTKGQSYINKFDTNLSFEFGNKFIDINNIELDKLLIFLEKRFGYKFKKDDYTKEKRVTLRINENDSLQEILKLLSTINNTNHEMNTETKEIEVTTN